MECISSYKDLTILINSGEQLKALYIKSITDIKIFLNIIDTPKGYNTKTSYVDVDCIHGDTDTTESIGVKKLVDELGKLESMLYLQECNLKRYYSIKEVMDKCANEVTDVTVKVSMLRQLGMTQEKVSELVEKSVNTIQRMDKKERDKNTNGVKNGVL